MIWCGIGRVIVRGNNGGVGGSTEVELRTSPGINLAFEFSRLWRGAMDFCPACPPASPGHGAEIRHSHYSEGGNMMSPAGAGHRCGKIKFDLQQNGVPSSTRREPPYPSLRKCPKEPREGSSSPGERVLSEISGRTRPAPIRAGLPTPST